MQKTIIAVVFICLVVVLPACSERQPKPMDDKRSKPLEQKIIVVRDSDAFKKADVSDYHELNRSMASYLSKMNIGTCEGYIMPGNHGPTLLLLSYDLQNPIPQTAVDALFDVMNSDLKARQAERGKP
jgi:hypothetical protein